MGKLKLASLRACMAALSLVFTSLLTACQSPTLEDEIATLGLDGGAIVYGEEGEEPHLLSFGGSPQDTYRYWSLSKPILAELVISLSEEDPDLLDSPVGAATVRQLLQHSGGWDTEFEPDPIALRTANCANPPQTEQHFEPGTRQSYSNIGYCHLAKFLSERFDQEIVLLTREHVPETAAMTFDEQFGVAGGWSGTALDYWQFASASLPEMVTQRPESAATNEPYYGFAWRVDGETLSHFGHLDGENFTLVVKRGNFAAVAMFRNTPADPYAARDILLPLLMELQQDDRD